MRQPAAPRQLPGRERALHVLRRPERRRARPHVDVRREPAVDHRRPGPDDLGERDHEQRLGVLLRQRPGQRHRGHRAGEGERRGHDRLAPRRHLDEPVGHRLVQPERRVRVHDRHQARLADQRVAIHAAGDAGDLDRVVDHGPPEREALPRLVEQRRERSVHVEVARLDRQVRRLEGSPTLLVDDVEAADHPDEGIEVGGVAGASPAIEVGHEGRPAHRPEHEVAVAEDEVALRVPGVQLEARGGERNELLDLRRINANHPGGRGRRPRDRFVRPPRRIDPALARRAPARRRPGGSSGPRGGLSRPGRRTGAPPAGSC